MSIKTAEQKDFELETGRQVVFESAKMMRGKGEPYRSDLHGSLVGVLVALVIGLVLLPVTAMAVPNLDNKWLCDPAPHPDMTYILRANSEFATLGVPFRTNEIGFRDRPVFEKVPGVFRILCLGDSVTFGTGVTNEQTYPNVLEGIIQQAAPPGMIVDVINAGISAYNIRNIRGLLEHYINYLKPDVVVYAFVENDLDDSVSAGPGGWLVAYDPTKSSDEPFILDDFPAVWLMRQEATQEKGIFSKIASFFDNRFEVASDTPPPLLIGSHPETNRRWGFFENELRQMKSLCQTADAPLLAYSFGMRNHSEPVFVRVGSVCQRVGVPHATTLPIFDKKTYMKKHSLGYDSHCNPEGHRQMAQRLFCSLLDQGVVPQQIASRMASHSHYDETYDPEVAERLEKQALHAPQVIDIANGEGALGLIGGVEMEGKMARYCILRLSGPGDRIEVTLSALLATPEQPQMISAEVEGIPVGSPITVPRSPVKVTFPIPEQYRDQPVEVKLLAHGPAWTPPLEDRLRGATPQTLHLRRVERVSTDPAFQS